MLETAIISNLMYVNLMSFENIGFSEESLVFSDSEKVPFKRNCVDGVYRVNVPFENNAYLWVELKENTGGRY